MPLLAWQHRSHIKTISFSPGFVLCTGAFFLIVGAHATARVNAKYNKNHFSRFYNSGDLTLIRIQKRISVKKGKERFYAEVLSVGNTPVEGKIYLTKEVDTFGIKLSFGDSLWTKKKLHRIKPPFNPGSFDFKDYAAKKNIFFQVYLKPGEFVLKPGKKKGLLRSSIHLNIRLQRALEKVLHSSKERAIAKALLLGDRNELSVDLLDQFKGAGAMHILAISGLHVGIIHLILMALTRPLMLLKKGRFFRVIFILLGLWCYALLTGMAVSAIRAVSMFTLLTVGQALNRNSSLLKNLVNSAFVLLLLNPMFLFNLGFQLSYSALIGIAMGTNLFEKIRRRKKPMSKLIRYFLGLILVSCLAQLGVMPLSLFYFKQFSGLFLISSLLLLPLLGPTLVFGYSVLGASMFYEIPVVIQRSFHTWLKVIRAMIEWLGSIDLLIFKEVYFPYSFCLLSILIILLIALQFTPLMKRSSILIYASGISLIGMQLIWIHQRVNVVRSEELIVFHERGESLVFRRKGSIFELTSSDQLSERGQNCIERYLRVLPGDYSIQTQIQRIPKPIEFLYVNESLICQITDELRIESISVLASRQRHPDVLVFSNAPKMNLERLLSQIRPGIVVVDGSNHLGFIRRSSEICQSLGIKIHTTLDKGAFLYGD